MKYEVVTPIYNGMEMAIEDYVFVDANNEEDAVQMAVQHLKDQYPNGYYSTVQPENETEGLRAYPVTVNSTRYEPIPQENRNVTPPAPTKPVQG